MNEPLTHEGLIELIQSDGPLHDQDLDEIGLRYGRGYVVQRLLREIHQLRGAVRQLLEERGQDFSDAWSIRRDPRVP